MSVSKNKMAEDYDDSVKGEPTFTIAGLDLSVPGTYTLDVPARFSVVPRAIMNILLLFGPLLRPVWTRLK